MQGKIVVELVSEQNISDLAVLLTDDVLLLQSLGSKQTLPPKNPNELYDEITKWQKSNKATCYVIRLKNRSIGLISLSHQKDTNARVGYWLASSQWHKGYTSIAFAQIIEIAKQRGFKKLSATIDPSNAASKRIWDKCGASFKDCSDGLTASLRM
jgi:RimJ/RimL family protein N-acetyltransferase